MCTFACHNTPSLEDAGDVTAVHYELRRLHCNKDLQFIKLCISLVNNIYNCRLNNANSQSCLFPQSCIYCWFKHWPCSKINNSNTKICNPVYLLLHSSFGMEHTSSTNVPPLGSGCCPRLCLSPLKPISASSVITVLHQMFIGRPRFLFPRGVPLRATLQI